MSNPEGIYAPLHELLQALQPDTLSVIASSAFLADGGASEALTRPLSGLPVVCHTPAEWLLRQEGTRPALVFVAWALEDLEPAQARQLIARLRDVDARRLLVATRGERAWSATDFVAMGLENIAEMETPAGPVRYAGFDIRTYKQVPDWLNPRFWANPERWNLSRW